MLELVLFCEFKVQRNITLVPFPHFLRINLKGACFYHCYDGYNFINQDIT